MSSSGSTTRTDRQRERLSPEDLAIALSHFDLGLISSIEDFPRGSRRAPKVVIVCERGKFLFKRRAKGKDDLPKVGFTHQIQLSLAAQNFPLPHLMGTRKDNNSMLVREGSIYEMFEYINGGGYTGSGTATFNSGRILGLYHKLLEGFRSDFKPPTGSYHNAQAIHPAIKTTVGSLPMDSRPPMDTLTGTIETVEHAYVSSAEYVKKLGMDDWPRQIVHGDWHPGNMLFRDKHVVAVIDYDAARLQQRVIDVANGVLQFSIVGGGDDPRKWPAQPDLRRFRKFMQGYDKVNVLSKAELQAVPYLMCEAMIAEAVLPIAATGSFGRIPGFPFLEMVRTKVDWILRHVDHLTDVLDA